MQNTVIGNSRNQADAPQKSVSFERGFESSIASGRVPGLGDLTSLCPRHKFPLRLPAVCAPSQSEGGAGG